MKRVIRDYRSLSPELRKQLQFQFPEGIRRSDLLSFPMGGGKRIYGVELRVGDTIYLIRGDFEERAGGFTILGKGEMAQLEDMDPADEQQGVDEFS